jgi:hypothetical protein
VGARQQARLKLGARARFVVWIGVERDVRKALGEVLGLRLDGRLRRVAGRVDSIVSVLAHSFIPGYMMDPVLTRAARDSTGDAPTTARGAVHPPSMGPPLEVDYGRSFILGSWA